MTRTSWRSSTQIRPSRLRHRGGTNTDTGNPHPDTIIYSGRNTATQGVTIDWQRIRGVRGSARGQLGGMFVRDFVASGTDSGQYASGKILACALIGCEVEGISVQSASSFTVKGCTVVGRGVDADNTMLIQIGAGADAASSGTHVIENNITEDLNIGGSPTLNNNYEIGVYDGAGTNLATAYASYFTGGATWQPTSIADAMAIFSLKIGGTADVTYGGFKPGAFGSGVATYGSPPASSGTTLIS